MVIRHPQNLDFTAKTSSAFQVRGEFVVKLNKFHFSDTLQLAHTQWARKPRESCTITAVWRHRSSIHRKQRNNVSQPLEMLVTSLIFGYYLDISY